MFLQRDFSYQCNTSLKWKLFMQAELDLVIKNCHSNRKFLMKRTMGRDLIYLWENLLWLHSEMTNIQGNNTMYFTARLELFFWSIQNDFPRLSGKPPSFSCSHFSDVTFTVVEHLGLINQAPCFMHCRHSTSAGQLVHQE